MLITYFLAQIMGVVCVLVSLAILLRKKVFIEVIHDVENNQALIFALGIISVVLGLLVVITHNFWQLGFLPLLITLIGWVMLIRGVLAIFVPQQIIKSFLRWARIEKLSWLYGLIILVIGLYLTYSGFIGLPVW
jgi:hypothetical protein